jgi:hypothetical protein
VYFLRLVMDNIIFIYDGTLKTPVSAVQVRLLEISAPGNR